MTQAMFIARRIQEYAERAGLPGTMIFLDWEQAFDKLQHEWLLDVLESYQIPKQIQELIKQMYKEPRFKDEIDGVESKWMNQTAGIRQGCPFITLPVHSHYEPSV